MSELDDLIQKTRNENVQSISEVENVEINNLFDMSSFVKPTSVKQIYIDKDIHEVFSKIKGATGIKIGTIASVIFQNWVEENKGDINQLLKTNNKFLI